MALLVKREFGGLQYTKRLFFGAAKTAFFVAHFGFRARSASFLRRSFFVQRDPDGLQYRKSLLFDALRTAFFVAHFVDDRREELDACFEERGIFVVKWKNNNRYLL